MTKRLPTRRTLRLAALMAVTTALAGGGCAGDGGPEAGIVIDGPVWASVSEMVADSAYFVTGEVLEEGPPSTRPHPASPS